MKKLIAVLAIVLVTVTTAFSVTQVTFLWDASIGADYYTLHMIDPGGTDSVVADNIADTQTSVIHEVTESGEYQFYVTATNETGTSGQSNIVATYLGVPGVPANLKIEVIFVQE